ncbi:MAG: hypothetical protein DRO39_02665 [Thermoprotei archaeon]|nr:MAG: hypothetical protein DRO39_02665 [Thermoprotei archaeon]
MAIFKKKLTEMEAPSVLAEIVKVIIANSAIDPLAIIKKYVPVPLPTPPSPLSKEQFADVIARAIVTGIPREKALEIIREIKNQLKDYKI